MRSMTQEKSHCELPIKTIAFIYQKNDLIVIANPACGKWSNLIQLLRLLLPQCALAST